MSSYIFIDAWAAKMEHNICSLKLLAVASIIGTQRHIINFGTERIWSPFFREWSLPLLRWRRRRRAYVTSANKRGDKKRSIRVVWCTRRGSEFLSKCQGKRSVWNANTETKAFNHHNHNIRPFISSLPAPDGHPTITEACAENWSIKTSEDLDSVPGLFLRYTWSRRQNSDIRKVVSNSYWS